jgi:hypothetical protein
MAIICILTVLSFQALLHSLQKSPMGVGALAIKKRAVPQSDSLSLTLQYKMTKWKCLNGIHQLFSQKESMVT